MRLFPRVTDVLGTRQIGADSEEQWRGLAADLHRRAVPGLPPARHPGRARSRTPTCSRGSSTSATPTSSPPPCSSWRATRGPTRRPACAPSWSGSRSTSASNASGEEVASALRADLPGGRRPAAPRGPGGERRLDRRPDPDPPDRPAVARCGSTRRPGAAAGARLRRRRVAGVDRGHGRRCSARSTASTAASGGRARPPPSPCRQLAQLENLGLAFVRDAAADGTAAARAPHARRAAVLGDLEPRRVPRLGRPDDRDRRRADRVPRAVHARGRARPAPARAARASPTGSTTAGCARSWSRARSSSGCSALAERPERERAVQAR